VRVRCKRMRKETAKKRDAKDRRLGCDWRQPYALFRGQALRDLNRITEGILIRRGLCSLANREVLAQDPTAIPLPPWPMLLDAYRHVR
jgi:hypothetical protein